MKARHQRIVLVIGGLAILGSIATLIFNAFESNLVFFFSPTKVLAGEAPHSRAFRIGGMVKPGSLKRESEGTQLSFIVTDTEKEVRVSYQGILPDLFKEGKGVVAQGKLNTEGIFVASEVLAKHDENYMPPEAAKAVQDAHQRAAENKSKEKHQQSATSI
ncbi:MAG: cytochrome c maturation protein CcmE [Pseudomonadota bacterium]